MIMMTGLAQSAKNAYEQTSYANCDLAQIINTAITKETGGTLRIAFGWTRKEDSYQKMGTNIAAYFVRYGPMEDENIVNGTAQVIVVQKPQVDSITLCKVNPCKKLGVQICAVTDKLQFRSDSWKKASTYAIDLFEQLSPEDKKKMTEEENFYPNCDLVGCSYVSISRQENGLLSIGYSWDPKKKNYEKIGAPISTLCVRHGPMTPKGELDDGFTLIAVFQKPENNSFTLKNIIPHKSYGMQICAITERYPFRFDTWQRAWTGTMDLVNFWRK